MIRWQRGCASSVINFMRVDKCGMKTSQLFPVKVPKEEDWREIDEFLGGIRV